MNLLTSIRALWLDFDWEDLDGPRSPTGHESAGGVVRPGPGDKDWGRSESLDPDNVGNIADEGVGHRG